ALASVQAAPNCSPSFAFIVTPGTGKVATGQVPPLGVGVTRTRRALVPERAIPHRKPSRNVKSWASERVCRGHSDVAAPLLVLTAKRFVNCGLGPPRLSRQTRYWWVARS